MTAPGGWQPQNQWGPPAGPPPTPPPARRSSGVIIAIAIGATFVLVLGIVGVVVLLSGDDEASASEVFLEPAASTGPDPFTASVATAPVATTTTTNATATTTAPGSGIPSHKGGEPGLYGGTRDVGSCNPAQLVTYLEANADKAKAWASVIGIRPSEIRSYVATLTTVVLRSDTRVTNHGFKDGKATTINAVLQAGTAVLVNDRGEPVVKCACGNPLGVPTPITSPRYTGPRWPGFSTTTIVVIQQSTTVITEFVLTDPDGELFTRPVGSSGNDDGPAPDTATTTTSRSSTTSSTATTEPPTSTSGTSPSTTSPPTTSPPSTQQVGLSSSTAINGGGVVGDQGWTATVTIRPDGSVTGSGSGNLVGNGTCLDGFGDVFSDFTARVSFQVSISGSLSGSTIVATASAPSGTLDSVTYSQEGPPNDVCRQEAKSTYLDFVNQSMGSFSISNAPGATATLQASFPGTVTVTG